jgi:putative FmdB family regulatory protein
MTVVRPQEEAMPTYEYRCKECDKRFEITCHLEERKKLAVCPKCKSKKVKPVFSSFTCAAPPKY